mgnify:FL=1
MKTYAWNPDKNDLLKKGRGISFEDSVFHIEAGVAVDIFAHPNQSKYPQQQIIVVCVEDYAYLVPFVENDEEIFLKTIIPSSKATKKYLGEENE